MYFFIHGRGRALQDFTIFGWGPIFHEISLRKLFLDFLSDEPFFIRLMAFSKVISDDFLWILTDLTGFHPRLFV